MAWPLFCRSVVYQASSQSDGVSGERRPARLRRSGSGGARHRVDEGRREAVQHRPDVHHSGRAALGDLSQVHLISVSKQQP